MGKAAQKTKTLNLKLKEAQHFTLYICINLLYTGNGDYLSVNEVLRFGNEVGTKKCVNISIKADALDEGREQFQVRLESRIPGLESVLQPIKVATVWILDSSTTPSPTSKPTPTASTSPTPVASPTLTPSPTTEPPVEKKGNNSNLPTTYTMNLP